MWSRVEDRTIPHRPAHGDWVVLGLNRGPNHTLSLLMFWVELILIFAWAELIMGLWFRVGSVGHG